MVSRFGGTAAAAARSAHAYYFSATLLYVPKDGPSVPFDAVPGPVAVETREIRGETRRVATRTLRVTSGITEARHDAAIRIGDETWAVDSTGRTAAGGLTIQVTRSLAAEVARPNYRS